MNTCNTPWALIGQSRAENKNYFQLNLPDIIKNTEYYATA